MTEMIAEDGFSSSKTNDGEKQFFNGKYNYIYNKIEFYRKF